MTRVLLLALSELLLLAISVSGALRRSGVKYDPVWEQPGAQYGRNDIWSNSPFEEDLASGEGIPGLEVDSDSHQFNTNDNEYRRQQGNGFEPIGTSNFQYDNNGAPFDSTQWADGGIMNSGYDAE
eukprot:gnl/MRDRNA2_/MRDRNA2_93341_c0_seq1.p1 gnl/MRDRNA2_/MRDRNA2_93341_c0~~gnl/MRDRNA2_/MRDRNA2_93341_c0_seq1.p1  ORF type:complete len:125 (+),score=17.59 gnl/MRDRNA2_/MRDRNA2_93341_c0_seq1:76-450(+)